MKKILIAISLLIASIAYADDHKYNFWWEHLPAVCSTSVEIERWAEDKKFTPVSVSYGRANGSPDGEVVYIVIYWLNDKYESFASVQTPQKPDEMCIVFRTFDLSFNPNMINEKDI